MGCTWDEYIRFHLEVPNTFVNGTGSVGLEYPLKSGGVEGYFVPKLVPKSISLFSYVIGKDVSDEELHLRLCSCQH